MTAGPPPSTQADARARRLAAALRANLRRRKLPDAPAPEAAGPDAPSRVGDGAGRG